MARLSPAEAATTALAVYATVAGGGGNTAGGQYSAVGGGLANQASRQPVRHIRRLEQLGRRQLRPSCPEANYNSAAGYYSFAAGRRAKANNTGAFVLADSSNFDFTPGVNNAFTARFTGGARFVLGIDGTGASHMALRGLQRRLLGLLQRPQRQGELPAGRRPGDPGEAGDLPITTWNAIGTDPGVRRMGPMAQDFYAAFGLGDDDKVITTGDLDGVALASIQGLYQIVAGERRPTGRPAAADRHATSPA